MTPREYIDWNQNASFLDGMGAGFCLNAIVVSLLILTGADAAYIAWLAFPASAISYHYAHHYRTKADRGLSEEAEKAEKAEKEARRVR